MNAATIIESSGKSVEYKSQDGIFSCLLEHEVKATKAKFEWTGPKISKGAWSEMLAFFRWTQETEKSEAQVRLFVHPTEGWKIWAFPQKGGTGMTTKEEDNEQAKLQRAAIGPEWLAFGTVHHHCSASAFQSGTDQLDEKAVDGLHITIGHLGQPLYDVHARMYIKGHKLTPKLSAFWDVGDEMREKLKVVEDLGYSVETLMEAAAVKQMGEPPPPDTTFNEQWKENYILPLRVTTADLPGEWCFHCQERVTDHKSENCPHRNSPRGFGHYHKTYGEAKGHWHPGKILKGLETTATIHGLSEDDFMEIIEEAGSELSQSAPIYAEMFELCREHGCTPEDLYEEMVAREARAAAKQGKEEAKETAGQANGLEGMTEAEIEYYTHGYGY